MLLEQLLGLLTPAAPKTWLAPEAYTVSNISCCLHSSQNCIFSAAWPNPTETGEANQLPRMIALAGTIGTVSHQYILSQFQYLRYQGLFLGSGKAIARAGPLGALYAFPLLLFS
jgi:hypothetical protein